MVLPDIIDRISSLHEPISVGDAPFLIGGDFSYSSAHRHIFDSFHYSRNIIIVVLGVDEVRIISHIYKLSQLEPLVPTMKRFAIFDVIECGNPTEPRLQMRKIIRDRICSMNRHST